MTFQFTSAEERQANYASLVSLAKDARFEMTGDENDHRITLTGVRKFRTGKAAFTATISRPNGELRVGGHGAGLDGKVVFLESAAAVKKFIRGSYL